MIIYDYENYETPTLFWHWIILDLSQLFKPYLGIAGLWRTVGSLKPASRKFCARPAQGFAQGKL